ncbi:MAG: hypothetical protein HQK61_10410 [Desulfamplus sp.]|nr:hypothetical protein [Desulfamplus sp.]
MPEDYLDIDLKRLAYFFSLVIITAVLTTLLYWFVFGFDSWNKNVKIASDLMLAATAVPYQQQPMQFQQVQPYQQQPQPFSNGMSAQAGGMTSGSGQYVCPVHGAVGLPQFNAAGAPVCPLGDQVMQFCAAPTTNNLALAAGG